MRLYPYIKSILRKKLGDIVVQEDLTQECLIGIHRNLGTYHPSRPFKPWASAIIRYKVADYFRELSKRQELSLDDGQKNVTEQAENPNLLIADEVIQLLGKLPEKLKISLQLVHFEGCSYSEAAQRQGITEVALRKRVSRAYEQLRKEVLKSEESNFADKH